MTIPVPAVEPCTIQPQRATNYACGRGAHPLCPECIVIQVSDGRGVGVCFGGIHQDLFSYDDSLMPSERANYIGSPISTDHEDSDTEDEEYTPTCCAPCWLCLNLCNLWNCFKFS